MTADPPPASGFAPAPALYPFASRWLASALGPIHYVDEGVGETILLVHGNPTWSFMYRQVIGALRDRYRCVALDLPGFGLSARDPGDGWGVADLAASVVEAIDALDLQGVTLVGHDCGGPIGLWAATERRARIRRLIMCNTWYWPVTDGAGARYAAWMASGPAQWLIVQRNLMVQRLLPAGLARPLDADELTHYRRVFPTPASRHGPARLARDLTAASPWFARLHERVLGQLRGVPVLLPWGMRDPLFPPETAARFRRPFDDATFIPLPNAKHSIYEDAPGPIVAAIQHWMPQH